MAAIFFKDILVLNLYKIRELIEEQLFHRFSFYRYVIILLRPPNRK